MDTSCITCTLRQVYDEVKEDEMDKACSTNCAKRNVCRILKGKPERQRPLGRPRRRWVNIIKMDLKETGWGGMNWIDVD
jgi:hypothetical protein